MVRQEGPTDVGDTGRRGEEGCGETKKLAEQLLAQAKEQGSIWWGRVGCSTS